MTLSAPRRFRVPGQGPRGTLTRMQSIEHFIAGRFVPPAGGAYLDNVEPATGRVYSRVADGDARDVEAAVQAATAAFPAWSATPAEARCRVMLRIADLIESRLDEFARAESVDTGKPLSAARGVDIPRAVKNLRFFATAILHEKSELHVTDREAINYTLRRPRGVAGLISPWNLPLYLLTWKVAPAIATGNTAVAKPSEVTPMTAHLLAKVCVEAGLPPGVLNVVHGSGAGAGQALVEHPRVATISFTGGTKTGRGIAATAAPMFKKLSLELGGKNPNVVFADADLDEAVAVSVRAAFSNQGQICLCGSRILVERPAYAPFLERFVAATKALKVGDPLEAGCDLGALVSRSHFDKVRSCIRLAVEEGGRIECGGDVPSGVNDRCAGGFFLPPTVITGLPAGCRTDREEIFGPVVTVRPFDDEAEAVAAANDTDYGLSATLWTRDLDRAHRVADALVAGTVWVNCWLVRDLRVPFGGMRHSGVGREGGEESLRFFTEPKNVCVRLRGDRRQGPG
ncbi:MAG: aldehyde dehydrogenase [Planctomycetota bacterium]|nr:MAG: aldehyde dehydrogenase [Planctomycetota bacterium]